MNVVFVEVYLWYLFKGYEGRLVLWLLLMKYYDVEDDDGNNDWSLLDECWVWGILFMIFILRIWNCFCEGSIYYDEDDDDGWSLLNECWWYLRKFIDDIYLMDVEELDFEV